MSATLAAVAFAATPANAGLVLSPSDPLRTYVEARAAAIGGDHLRSAQLLANLAQRQPGEVEIAAKAIAEAIGAGRFDLALGLARNVPANRLTTDARLLLAVDAVKRGHSEEAAPWLAAAGDTGNLSFLSPLIAAWDAAERGQADRALASIDEINSGNLLAPLAAEQRAFILLKLRRSVDAEPYARRAIGAAATRDERLRLAFADGFLAAGDKARALMILDGMGAGVSAARQRIQSGRSNGQAIDTGAKALSETLVAFAGDLSRMERAAPPVGLVQVARFADPRNSSATALLAILYNRQDRPDEALALLRTIDRNDALISPVRDVEVRLLIDEKRLNEAYQVAAAAVAAPGAESADYSRLGEVYAGLKRYDLAADAYGRAIALAGPQGDLWALHLLRASAYEEANRWPEAKGALAQGLALKPDQPLLLNFLGYSKLERGEDVEAAEAMIRKAIELAPDDASIIDSLGWAQFKRGKTDDAIATLQRAAEKDPAQAEIQEHLGDALFKSGRRYEARFAWSAALITAEDEVAGRVRAKIDRGLSSVNAAP